MKYRANKTITRYYYPKKSVVIAAGKLYTEEQVQRMPAWYLTDGHLTEVK